MTLHPVREELTVPMFNIQCSGVTTGLSNLGLRTPPIQYPTRLPDTRGQIADWWPVEQKWSVFSFASPANRSRTLRNCRLPGGSLTEQLPPTLDTDRAPGRELRRGLASDFNSCYENQIPVDSVPVGRSCGSYIPTPPIYQPCKLYPRATWRTWMGVINARDQCYGTKITDSFCMRVLSKSLFGFY